MTARFLNRPIEEWDVGDPTLFVTGEVDEMFARLRAERPVHFCAHSSFGPYWSITRHADIEELLARPEGLSSAAETGGSTLGKAGLKLGPSGFSTMDPPHHTSRRRVVAPAFGPRNVARLEQSAREYARVILDGVVPGTAVDLNELFGPRYVLRNTADLLGMAVADVADLMRWAVATTGAGGEQPLAVRMAAHMALGKRVTDLRRARATAPPGEDPIALLAQDPETGRIGAAEFVGHVLLLIFASYHTIRGTLVGSMAAFASYPEQRRLLDAGGGHTLDLPDEAIRWVTPAVHTRRTATSDIAIGGELIPRGSTIVCWLRSANMDEAVFDAPTQFRIDRPNARAHLTFAGGIHRCLGARLARMQVRVAWEEILARGLTFTLVEPPRNGPSNFVPGIENGMARVGRIAAVSQAPVADSAAGA